MLRKKRKGPTHTYRCKRVGGLLEHRDSRVHVGEAPVASPQEVEPRLLLLTSSAAASSSVKQTHD